MGLEECAEAPGIHHTINGGLELAGSVLVMETSLLGGTVTALAVTQIFQAFIYCFLNSILGASPRH